MKVVFEDETSKQKHVFEHDEGLVDYLKKIVAERGAKAVHEAPFTLNKDDGLRLDLVLQWTEATDEHMRSYVNGIPTGSGGTHENGLRAGIGKAVRNFIETHNLSPKGVTLVAEDIREGLTGVLSVFIQEPQFQGQTKDRLNNPELVSAVDGVVRPALEHWLNHNISVAEAIVARIILAARAREASRAAQAEVSRKSATSTRLNLPGKLSDCTNSDERRQRDLHRRRRFGRRVGEAGPRSGAAGDSAAARQGAEHRERVAGEGAREQGADRSRDGARLRPRQELRAAAAALRQDHHPGRRRLGRQSHRHAAADVHLPAPAAAHHAAARCSSPSRRSIASTSARKRTGRSTMRSATRILKQHAKNGRGTPEITRFKGLGEMMPKVLWETTLNPRTRRLLRVEITDQIVTDRVINELMGKDASARFRFIMERADEAEELDV